MRARVILMAAMFLFAAPAQATVSTEMEAMAEQVWSVVVRYLRVEADYPVDEKDQATGYIIFRVPFRPGSPPYRAALEVLLSSPPPAPKASPDAGVAAPPRSIKQKIKLQLTVKGAPTYVEQSILDRIVKKLSAEMP